MVRVRFAPSPTGSLHVGSALSAVVNRRFADDRAGLLLLRIDDTDTARNVPGGEEALLAELEWLGVRWNEGPVRQSERRDAHLAAARRLEGDGTALQDADGSLRFTLEHRPTLVRADGMPTYHLASVVDDLEFGVTHVLRGKDHLSNTPLHIRLAEALGGTPPEYVHHGLIVGDDGRKLSKRASLSSLAELRAAGIPPEAVRRYLEELGLPRGDVHFDPGRLRRHAIDVIGELADEELARRSETEPRFAPALRGARDLNEAREIGRSLASRPAAQLLADAAPTLTRFRELLEGAPPALGQEAARAILRELKAVGGDLRELRRALTGSERGPELWAVLVALDRAETLARVNAAVPAPDP